MAATVSLATGATFNTNSGTHTAVVTPAVGDLIVLIVANSGYTGTTAPTDNNADGLGTYTLVKSATKATSADTIQIYVRNALIGSATSTTYTHAPATTTGGGLAVVKVTGMTLSGASAVRSSGSQDNQAAATPAPVLNNTPLTTNPIIGAVFNASNTASMTPRTGYTELTDVGYSTPTTGLEVMSRNSGETSATLTWGGASATAFSSVAIELAYDSAPTVALDTADLSSFSTATPQLAFTGTDADGEAITYQVQVDTVSTFDSQGSTPARVTAHDATGSGTTSASATYPASPTGNNLLVAVVASDENSTGPSTPTGWSSASNTGDSSGIVSIFYKLAAGTETTVTSNDAAAASMQIAIYEYSGIVTVSPTDVAGATSPSGSGLTATTPSVTTTQATELAIAAASWEAVTNTFSSATNSFTSVSSVANKLFTTQRILSATGTYSTAITTTGSSGTNHATIATFKGSGATPLYDKVSGTDTGFTDITNGAHTSPFTSGEQIGYTTPSLSNGTYYWRVRGKDPSGTNTYGAWASTRSFTVSTGGGGGTPTNQFFMFF